MQSHKFLGEVPCDNALKEALLTDYHTAPIGDENIAILEYAEKVTSYPSSITREDVDRLRSLGFTDKKIHDVVQVAAYFNYINRLADALGVELEEGYE